MILENPWLSNTLKAKAVLQMFLDGNGSLILILICNAS